MNYKVSLEEENRPFSKNRVKSNNESSFIPSSFASYLYITLSGSLYLPNSLCLLLWKHYIFLDNEFQTGLLFQEKVYSHILKRWLQVEVLQEKSKRGKREWSKREKGHYPPLEGPRITPVKTSHTFLSSVSTKFFSARELRGLLSSD